MSNHTPDTGKKQPDERADETAAAIEDTAAATAAADTTKETPAPETTGQAEQADGKKTRRSAKRRPIRSAEAKRRLRHGHTATLITLGVVVIALLVNIVFYILGGRFPLTIDLSSDGIYSLSEESVEIAKGVTSPINIVIFAAEETFSNTQSTYSLAYTNGYEPLQKVFSEFYNALRQYNSYSNGNVAVTYIDMNRNPTAVTQYAANKGSAIEDGDILFIRGDRCKYANINSDLFTMDSSTYAISSTVEQTMATKIQAVQSDTDRVLTVFTGFSEDRDLVDGLTNIYDLNGYDVEEVNLTRSVDINKNTVCAIIPAPTADYTDEAIERLRKWIANDGKQGQNLLVFTGPTAECPNLYEFLSVEYGLEVTDRIVTETDMNRIYAYNPFYPYADIPETDFTKNGTGEAKALFWSARQIIPHWEQKTDTSTQYSVNLVTFADSARLMTIENINAGNNEEQEKYDGDIVGMAVAVTEGYQNTLQVKTSTRVAVCGSSYAAYQAFTSMSNVENENLFLDVMSELTGVTNAINISSKTLETETISFSTSTQLIVGLLLFTLVLPIGLLIAGLVVFLRRRHL